MVAGALIMKIFISYRHDDCAPMARLIQKELAKTFGDSNILIDVHIHAATDFHKAIDAALDNSSILVVVIGPKWISLLNENIKLDRKDWVRHEIEGALARGVRVFPLFVEGGKMPEERDLPTSLSELTRYQGRIIHSGASLDHSIAEAVNALQETTELLGLDVPEESSAKAGARYWDQCEGRRRGRWALGLAALIVGVLFVWREYWPPPAIDSAALGHLLYDTCWISYDPSSFALDANREPVFPRIEALEEDLNQIRAAGFNGLLTSTSRGIMADVPRLAKQRGLKVIMGVWNPADRQEVSRAIRQARYVDAFCVGHSGFPDRYSVADARRAIFLLKKRTGLPAAVSEHTKYYTPQLSEIGDWLFPDAHLSLKDQPDGPATANVDRDVREFMILTETISAMASRLSRPLILKNVAYPHTGIPGASPLVQAEFFRRLLEHLNDAQYGLSVKVAIVAQGAFDCPWKTKKPFLSWDPYTGLIQPLQAETGRTTRFDPLKAEPLLSPAGLELLRWYPHLSGGNTTNPDAR